MSLYKHHLFALALIGGFRISAVSAGPILQSKDNVVTSSTGKLIVMPSSSFYTPFFPLSKGLTLLDRNNQSPSVLNVNPGTKQVGCGYGGSSEANYVGNSVMVKSSSVRTFPWDSWAPYSSPYSKAIEMCASFDIPNDQTSQSDNANSQPIPPSPTPTITPDSSATTFYWNPYTPLKLSNYFQAGYMPLVPHTNPAMYYPETSSAGGIAYERNFTDNQG